jgi:PAS domain S-box-containing protein
MSAPTNHTTMQENYHLLVESIKDYAIYMLDPKGHVLTWNVGAQQMKGYTDKEIEGTHFSILFTPEDRETGKPDEELKAALEKGRYEEEGWRLRKDGRKFWANIILTPVYAENNEHVGFAKITRDLTEKRRSDELYQLLVSQVKEYALFMMDNNGEILTWNEGAERIKGYTEPEVIGKHFSFLYTPEDQEIKKPNKALAIAKETGKFEEEGWRMRKDGSYFWANVVLTPIYKDELIGFAKITRDLTKRKELERLTQANLMLESANKELERFAAIASHDLKEPLRKITMYSDLVLNDGVHTLSDKQKDYLTKVISSCKRMDRLIDDVLKFSTFSTKQHFEKCSLNKIASDVHELLEHTIAEKQAVIRFSDLPEGIIIPSQMRQLFQNLISNALKFSKKEVPPEIIVQYKFLNREDIPTDELWPADEYLQLTFKDNGIGFKQEYAEKIFNLFDRLNSSSSYEGTGMGLAICKKIVENHGGRISASSELGVGSEFTIVIPA